MWRLLDSATNQFFPSNWQSQPLPSSQSPPSSLPSPLCSVCRIAIQETPKLASRSQHGLMVPHHQTANSFRESVHQGCHLCSILWHKIPKSGQDIIDRKRLDGNVTILFYPASAALYGPNNITICMKVTPNIDWWRMAWRLLMGRIHDDAETATALFALQPAQALRPYNLHLEAGDNTRSEESLKLAMRWYKECVMNHSRCRGIRPISEWFPTRLIDIGCSQNCEPRLLITQEAPPRGPYVTLSHCWGSARFLQLTHNSLRDLTKAIPFSDLPKTFCDAIYVARHLGFRYIWIDSLCIIQDSADDWTQEASLMHLVYSNAMCNIAATGATDSSKGLFRQRSAHTLYPCEVDTYWNGVNNPMRYQILDQTFWQTHMIDAPLNQRAWVVQERFLAPRVLHFGTEQVMWECHELDAAEKYPAGIPSQPGSAFKMFERIVGQARMSIPRGRGLDDSYALSIVWSSIIRVYSKSQLTKPEDKLIAIAGIAKKFQSLMNDEYIAGLWKGCLASQLTWYVKHKMGNINSPSRPSRYRAPSFSWMAVDGEIVLSSKKNEGSLVDVVDVQIVTTTADKMGLIKEGFLRIQGILKPLRLSRSDWFGLSRIMTVNGVEILDKTPDPNILPGPLIILDIKEDKVSADLYCMNALFIEGRINDGIQGHGSLSGLILEPTGRELGQFRRIGVYFSMRKELINLLLAPIENGEMIPCESYDASSGKNTICIV